MKNINEIIDVFRVECRCVYNGGSKEHIVYEDNIIIINNFETAKAKYNYMLSKCNALGYYAHYDYYVRIRKCDAIYEIVDGNAIRKSKEEVLSMDSEGKLI